MDDVAARAVREWIVDRITLITDNEGDRYAQIRRAASESVRELVGDGEPAARFFEVQTGDPLGYADAVGARVSELLREWIEQGIPDEILRRLVLDVLDLGDRQQRVLLGEHYMPSADEFGGES